MNGASVTLFGSTISTNGSTSVIGGGLYIARGTNLSTENNIVAGNTGVSSPDVFGILASSDHDLIGTTTGYTLTVGHSTGDLIGSSPRLAPLGNYGGPTQTMPLLPGSTGIDAGDPASGNLPLSLPGLVDWYEGEGNTLDSSVPHNATSSAGVTYAAGEVGQAFNLNGSSFVSVPSAPSLGFTTAVTLDAWVNPSTLNFSGTYAAIVANSGAGARNYGLFVTSVGAVHLSYVNSSGVNVYITTDSGLVSPGSWTNLAGIIDTTGMMQIWKNGQLVDSQAASGRMVTDNAPLTIGASDGAASFFQGQIDEVQVYNRALAPDGPGPSSLPAPGPTWPESSTPPAA